MIQENIYLQQAETASFIQKNLTVVDFCHLHFGIKPLIS